MMASAAERVAAALQAAGVTTQVIEYAESTRTAEEAAQAIGTTPERIVKSLVFMAGERGILVLCSGKHRVDMARLEGVVGARARRATAEEARAQTGYAIGGVPPLGHAQPLRTLLDAHLLTFDVVYAAAGTPHTVFAIAPAELLRVTGAEVVEVGAA